jgi:signal transduction histidine kinase
VRGILKSELVDVLLAAVFTGLTVVAVADSRAAWPAFPLATLTVAPIALRQRAPVATMAVIAGALTAYTLFGYGDPPNSGIGLLIAMFTVATLRPRRVAAVLWLASMTVLAVACVTDGAPLGWSVIGQSTVQLLGAWVLGESTRRWGERTERLAERAARAVADERVRIARELHDVVAHHMAVISLQAGVAQYVIDSDLPTARQAITTVGDTSREALAEMRRLLDVLRLEDGEDLAPQPGLAALDDLVDRTRGAGLPVDVVVTGRARPLPPGPDLCAYRVAQESLTNALKHAGPAAVRIDLDYGERTLTLKVTDDGSATGPHRESPTAHGIRGMRERAELYGGVLTAGPADAGGFAVVVRLPMSEAR